MFDSDGIIQSTSDTTSETCAITLQDSKPVTYVVKDLDTCVNNIVNLEDQQIDNVVIETVQDVDAQVNVQEITPLVDHDEYVNSMLSHSKMLKDEEHLRHMEMAEEEHAIKMAIHKEKLRCAILEREVLEFKKVSQMKHIVSDS